MDERAGRLGHLRLGERVHPHRALILSEERRVPVARQTGPEALDRHVGLHEEAASEGERAPEEPPLLDDQDVVELAPEERLEREHLLPARRLFGGAARPEGHGSSSRSAYHGVRPAPGGGAPTRMSRPTSGDTAASPPVR